MQTLPSELVDAIIGQVSHSWSEADLDWGQRSIQLSNCALVSRQWRQIAQRYLYRELVLDNQGTSRCRATVERWLESPAIQLHRVEMLYAAIPTLTRSDTLAEQLYNHCDGLRTLVIRAVSVNMLKRLGHPHLANLAHLTLFCLEFMEDTQVEFRLTTLELHLMNWGLELEPALQAQRRQFKALLEPSLLTLSALRLLNVHGYTSDIFSALADQFQSVRMPALRHLELSCHDYAGGRKLIEACVPLFGLLESLVVSAAPLVASTLYALNLRYLEISMGTAWMQKDDAGWWNSFTTVLLEADTLWPHLETLRLCREWKGDINFDDVEEEEAFGSFMTACRGMKFKVMIGEHIVDQHPTPGSSPQDASSELIAQVGAE